MHVWKSYICSNRLDVQETNCRAGFETALELWERLCNFRKNRTTCFMMFKDMENIDSIPSNVQSSRQEALLHVFEDNEPVIKMIIKGRSPTMSLIGCLIESIWILTHRHQKPTR